MAQDYKDLAYSVLLLERQLESYEKLHAEELEALWKALAELKGRILALAPADLDTDTDDASARGDAFAKHVKQERADASEQTCAGSTHVGPS